MNHDADDAGRLLAGRYRLPRLPADAHEPVRTQAYDTASGQEVRLRQVALPETVDAEFVGDGTGVAGGAAAGGATGGAHGHAARASADPGVRRAVEAARAASLLPDHPRLDQVFDVFVDGDGLWIVSELLPARPLSELLAERPLTAHRAAEIAADVLAALRTVHARGWVHRNITDRTVLVCDDGRAVLTGLAAGAAEEALCGYDPLPDPHGVALAPRGGISAGPAAGAGRSAAPPPGVAQGPLPAGFERDDPAVPPPNARNNAPAAGGGGDDAGRAGIFGFEGADSGGGAAARAARRGAIAAYRAGTQAATARREEEARGTARAPARTDGWAEPGTARNGPAQDGTAQDGTAQLGSAQGGPAAPHSPLAAQQDYGPQGQPYGRARDPEPSAGTGPHGANGPAGPLCPTALPGARHGGSRPVPTAWSASATRAGVPGAAGSAEAGTGAGEAAGTVVERGTEEAAAAAGRYRGPATSLAADRARQARMTVVGPVTERWAPEQAGPVHENWRLAPPVGPAADLWALGVLLFRAVQGHAPYPEDSAPELVQMVCSEPPAFAEDCGPLRPVVESLLRQDPTERPDFEVLRGWLRSLIRSAPEPDIGLRALAGPASLEPGRPADPRRLPILRRRGELVRRRRGRKRPAAARGRRRPAAAADPPGPEPRAARTAHAPRPPREARPPRPPRVSRGRRAAARPRSPHSLGRLLLGGVLLMLTLVVLYAMWFLPEQNTAGEGGDGRQRGSLGEPGEVTPAPGKKQGGERNGDDGGDAPSGTQPQSSPPVAPAEGFRNHDDATGFRIAVPEGWDRRGVNDRGQVRFDEGDFEMVVVKGRDSTAEHGKDPMAYQSGREPELKPFRTSDWSSASRLRRIDVGGTAMAEGTYTWKDSSGREVYVRNRAMLLGGHYHLVLVIGPEDERAAVDRYFEGAVDTYRVLAD